MAFDGLRLGAQVDSIGGGLIRIFGYNAGTDTVADITASDYIPNAADHGLRDKDILVVSVSGEDIPLLYYVTGIDAEGNATLLAVEDGAYATYEGGAAYTTKERFRREIPLEDTSVAAMVNDSDQDAGPAFKALVQEAAFNNKKLTAKMLSGTLWLLDCDMATDDADRLEGSLVMEMNPEFTLRGIPGVEAAVFQVEPKLAQWWLHDFHAEHLRIRCDGRLFTGAAGSSSALVVSHWNHVSTLNFWGFGGTQAEDQQSFVGLTIGGDSGISQNSAYSSCHINPYMYGFNDLAFYGTADPPGTEGIADPPWSHGGDVNYKARRGHSLINLRADHCNSAIAFKRLQQNCSVIGGLVENCRAGASFSAITGVPEAGFYHAPQVTVTGLQGKYMMWRFMSCGPETRLNASNCYVEDFGRDIWDLGVDPNPEKACAYLISGASHGLYSNCRAAFREMEGQFSDAGLSSFGFYVNDYTDAVTGSGVTNVSEYNIFNNCMVEGANSAYYEDDASGATNNFGTVFGLPGGPTGTFAGSRQVFIRSGSASQIRQGIYPDDSMKEWSTDEDWTVTRDQRPIQMVTASLATVDRVMTLDENARLRIGKIYEVKHSGTGNKSVIVKDEAANVLATIDQGNWRRFRWNGTTFDVLSPDFNYDPSLAWTPVLTFGGSAASMTGTFEGRYTKVGQLVTLWCDIILTNKGISTGDLAITGLPVTFTGTVRMAGSVRLTNAAATVGDTALSALLIGGGTQEIQIYKQTSGDAVQLAETDIANDTVILVTVTGRI